MATPTKPKGDLITQLQLELNHVSELLFATVAELQRDAGPVAINDEAIVTSEQKAAYNVAERSKGFAAEILATHSSIDQLISKLPAALVPEGEQLATISELQQQAAELQAQLEKEHMEAEEKLRQVHGMYEVLVQDTIRHRAYVNARNDAANKLVAGNEPH